LGVGNWKTKWKKLDIQLAQRSKKIDESFKYTIYVLKVKHSKHKVAGSGIIFNT
jgi:hypothetical protein